MPSRQVRLDKAIEKIREGLGEVQDIKEELENWKSGLEGTNLENSDLYSRLDDAVSTLEDQTSEIDSVIGELENVEVPSGLRFHTWLKT
jgi:predicted nuclease with TOPRIM domain